MPWILVWLYGWLFWVPAQVQPMERWTPAPIVQPCNYQACMIVFPPCQPNVCA